MLGDTKDHKDAIALRVFEGWWDGRYFIQGSVCEVNGNRNVAYLNRNDVKRNLNLNWWDDDWNGNYRFLAVRYSFCFSRE